MAVICVVLVNKPSYGGFEHQVLHEKVQKPMTFINSFLVIMVRKCWVFIWKYYHSLYVVNMEGYYGSYHKDIIELLFGYY